MLIDYDDITIRKEMDKKRIIKFVLVIAIFGGLLIYFLTSKADQNKLNVVVDNNLDLDKVRIDKGFYSINKSSDENLIKMGLDKVVYSNQKAKSFETICGENDFLVVYDNEFYAIFRHFIPNDFYDGLPKPHTYNFYFIRNGNKINLTLNIEGEDREKFERDMVKVSDANNNIWGRQIEK